MMELKNNNNYVGRLRLRVKKLLVRKDRETSRVMFHVAEYIDAAFVSLAMAENMLIKHLKEDGKRRRKSDNKLK